MAYTYLIGWSSENLWYYGVRYAKDSRPEELMKTYFTSSKYVKEKIDSSGLPDVIQVRKIFETADKAREWEHKVLKRMKVVGSDKWLNKTDNKSISLECCKYFHTEEIRKKKSLARIGKKYSLETRQKLSNSLKGRDAHWLRGIKKPSHSLRMQKGNNPSAKKIMTPDGKIYDTIMDYNKAEGMSYYKTNRQIKLGVLQVI